MMMLKESFYSIWWRNDSFIIIFSMESQQYLVKNNFLIPKCIIFSDINNIKEKWNFMMI